MPHGSSGVGLVTLAGSAASAEVDLSCSSRLLRGGGRAAGCCVCDGLTGV